VDDYAFLEETSVPTRRKKSGSPKDVKEPGYADWWNAMLEKDRRSRNPKDHEDLNHPAGLPDGFFE